MEEHLGNVEPPPHDPTLLQVSAARGSTPPSAPTCSRCSRGRHTTSCRSSSRASRARSALGAPIWTWATGRASCSSCVPTWRGPGEHWVRAPGVVPSRWGGFRPLLGPGWGGSHLLLGPCGVEGGRKVPTGRGPPMSDEGGLGITQARPLAGRPQDAPVPSPGVLSPVGLTGLPRSFCRLTSTWLQQPRHHGKP